MHPWIFILFSGLLRSKPLLYLVAQFVPVLATGSVLRLPPVLSQRTFPLLFFPPSWVLSQSWHYTMFLLIVCFSCPHPGSIRVSRGLQFWLENGVCGVRTQRDELVLPDVLLPDTLADSQWYTGSSRCVSEAHGGNISKDPHSRNELAEPAHWRAASPTTGVAGSSFYCRLL